MNSIQHILYDIMKAMLKVGHHWMTFCESGIALQKSLVQLGYSAWLGLIQEL